MLYPLSALTDAELTDLLDMLTTLGLWLLKLNMLDVSDDFDLDDLFACARMERASRNQDASAWSNLS